jgi:hypothetical protein
VPGTPEWFMAASTKAGYSNNNSKNIRGNNVAEKILIYVKNKYRLKFFAFVYALPKVCGKSSEMNSEIRTL